jgi:hypothetical protein
MTRVEQCFLGGPDPSMLPRTARLASGSRFEIAASPVAEECKRTAERFGAGTKQTDRRTILTLNTADEAFIRHAHSA